MNLTVEPFSFAASFQLNGFTTDTVYIRSGAPLFFTRVQLVLSAVGAATRARQGRGVARGETSERTLQDQGRATLMECGEAACALCLPKSFYQGRDT